MLDCITFTLRGHLLALHTDQSINFLTAEDCQQLSTLLVAYADVLNDRSRPQQHVNYEGE